MSGGAFEESAALPHRSVKREEIFVALRNALESLPPVYSMWEAGAVSFDRVDRWSDIDVNVDAEDGHAGEVFEAVERTLDALGGIEQKLIMPFPPDHAYEQGFYRLVRASRFLMVDLAIFKHSAPDKYLEPSIHGQPRFAFRKPGAGEAGPFDAAAHRRRMRQRLERLRARVAFFGCFVEKEIQRGNAIEAVSNYQRLYIDTLTEALRMKHQPLHFDFGVRYVHYELPSKVLARLTPLWFVADMDDLAQKAKRAERWLRTLLDELSASAGEE